MKKISLVLFAFLLVLLSTTVFAQSTKWEDYGLTEDDVQYLTDSEKQSILRSKTPQQTIEKQKEDIQKNGTSSILNFIPLAIQQGQSVSTQKNPEITSCFDMYSFGSIQADMTSQSSNVVSGMTMDFFGDIKNNNAYPIVEGTLYVKIFKTRGEEKDPNGPDVVDQFVAIDNITIPANGTVPAKFSWKIPAYAQTGDYQLATYFTSDKRFNLLGLSFTDDIVGNSFNFNVDGESKGMSFDKSSVVINDNPYYFAAYPPRIQREDDAHILLSLDNTTDQKLTTTVEWKLYQWDSMNPGNLIRSFTSDVTIDANSSQDIELNIPEKESPVYYLVGEVKYEDTKSIVGMRFVREGVDKVRLNFPALTSYPLKKDESTTMFTCLHNSGTSSEVSNNKVVLEIKDNKGRVVESHTYEGEVTGDMMAIKKDFISKVNLDTFSLHASLYTNNKLVDESIMEYDCKLIDPASCDKTGLKEILSLIFGLVILLIVVLLIKKYKIKNNIILPLFLCALLGSLFIMPNVTEAKSATWNKIIEKNFEYFWSISQVPGWYGSGSGWTLGLKNPNITVKYNVEVRNRDTNALIAEGASVPIGTDIALSFKKHVSTDISWFGTGYSSDSPYGAWKLNAAPGVEDTCKDNDFVNSVKVWYEGTYLGTVGVYIPLRLDFPEKSITNKDNLSCGNLNGDESNGYTMNCTVNAVGTIKPYFNFGATTGKFYYRYKTLTVYNASNSIPKDTCISTNLPMKTDGSTYVLQVPQKTITYSFTAVTPPPANRAPAAPVISGPVTGTVSTTYTFGIKGTDPDGDRVRYALDWNNDGVIDQWLPSTGFVTSGTLQNTNKSWSSIGTQSFKAKTYDEHGLASGWTSHSITLAVLPVNGVCSKTTIDVCTPGTPVVGVDTLNDEVWSCTGYNEGATDYCTLPKKDPLSADAFRCSVTPNPALRNELITYTASDTAGLSYKWFTDPTKTNPILNETRSVHKTSYENINSYTRTVEMKTSDGTETANCPTVTVGCGTKPLDETCGPTDITHKVYGSCRSDGTYASSYESCTLSTAPAATFYFNPNIVSTNSQCGLFLEAKRVNSCTLLDRLKSPILTINPILGETNISVSGEKKVGIGTYTLSCIATDGTLKAFPDTKVCISNPDIKED